MAFNRQTAPTAAQKGRAQGLSVIKTAQAHSAWRKDVAQVGDKQVPRLAIRTIPSRSDCHRLPRCAAVASEPGPQIPPGEQSCARDEPAGVDNPSDQPMKLCIRAASFWPDGARFGQRSHYTLV